MGIEVQSESDRLIASEESLKNQIGESQLTLHRHKANEEAQQRTIDDLIFSNKLS